MTDKSMSANPTQPANAVQAPVSEMRALKLRPGARLEIHLLQNLPPSNINRDDTGSPKDAVYGGVRRARVSSQSWKRAMRQHAREQQLLAETDFAWRTKFLPQMLRQELQGSGVPSPLADGIAARVIASITLKEVSDGAEALLLFGVGEARALASVISRQIDLFAQGTPLVSLEQAGSVDGSVEGSAQAGAAVDSEVASEGTSGDVPEAVQAAGPGKKGKKEKGKKAKALSFEPYKDAPLRLIVQTLQSVPSLDVALHGRMLASNQAYSVDGALQVAHALGTHAAPREFDYYTGIDELKTEGGAGMIGETEFVSSVMYRYLCLDLAQLQKNLTALPEGEQVEAMVRGARSVVESAFLSMPRGKRTAFAANTLPAYALVGVSERGVAMSLAGAYLAPVTATDAAGADRAGYMHSSVERLESEFSNLTRVYASHLGAGAVNQVPSWQRLSVAQGGEALAGAHDAQSLDALLAGVESRLRELLGKAHA